MGDFMVYGRFCACMGEFALYGCLYVLRVICHVWVTLRCMGDLRSMGDFSLYERLCVVCGNLRCMCDFGL